MPNDGPQQSERTRCLSLRKRLDAGATNQRQRQSVKSRPAMYATGRSVDENPSGVPQSISGLSSTLFKPYPGLRQLCTVRTLADLTISRHGRGLK